MQAVEEIKLRKESLLIESIMQRESKPIRDRIKMQCAILSLKFKVLNKRNANCLR